VESVGGGAGGGGGEGGEALDGPFVLGGGVLVGAGDLGAEAAGLLAGVAGAGAARGRPAQSFAKDVVGLAGRQALVDEVLEGPQPVDVLVGVAALAAGGADGGDQAVAQLPVAQGGDGQAAAPGRGADPVQAHRLSLKPRQTGRHSRIDDLASGSAMRGVDPMSQAVPGSPAVGPRVEVVALVTSAGGMDALTTVLRQLPDDYIVKPPRRPRRPRRRRLQP
jgi:hypothetical protein